MLHHLRKYRHLFAIAMMGFYLLGGLQFPMLECLHFFSHLDDLATGQYNSHTFHSHDGSHKHGTLAVLDGLDENSHEQQAPVNETSDPSPKKFPQLFYAQLSDLPDYRRTHSLNFAKSNVLASRLAAVPSPPPRA